MDRKERAVVGVGWWQVSADTLASSRFVVSPLAEAVASLLLLERATAAHPGERAWLEAHLSAYRRRAAGDPVSALVIRSALAPRWTADFLTPAPVPAPPGQAPPSFAEELARVRATPPDRARADLAVALGGPLPAALDRDDLAERAADAVAWVWTHTVLPDWPRRQRVLEADVVARTAQLGRAGWAEALNGMRPGVRWLGGSRLQINTYDNPPRELDRAQLLFIPVTPNQSWVCWDIRTGTGWCTRAPARSPGPGTRPYPPPWARSSARRGRPSCRCWPPRSARRSSSR